MLNCFSVDVEAFAESSVESFHIPAHYLEPAKQNDEIMINTEATLALMSDHQIKGTFFILGRIARDLPSLIGRIAAEGHEIACHSFEHQRIYGQNRGVFREDVRRAKKYLEDLSGQPVLGFRAPDFSITEKSLWAIDELREAGFLYDSSIYPVGLHDVYGITDAKPAIHRLSNGLIEWPLPTLELLGKRLPAVGGGYFRLYPFLLTRWAIEQANTNQQPCMFYIHPWEVGPARPKIEAMTAMRRLRHYFRSGALNNRIASLFRRFQFAPAHHIIRTLEVSHAI